MKRTLSREVKKFNGKQVTCSGWVQTIRDVGALVFVILRDRTGYLQLICKNAAAEEARKLSLESSITVSGVVKVDEKIKMGGVELQVEKLTLVAGSLPKLPVDVAGKTETNFEHRFDHRVIDLRREEPQAIFAVQSTLCSAFREILNKEGFTEIHTPKIIATGTEGGTQMFPVKYFEREAFLAQSPQFYKQMLVGSGFERVFEIAPVFRAEEHNTPWHLNEYISLDFEMGFIRDEKEVIKYSEKVLKHMLKRVKEKNPGQLAKFNSEIKLPAKIPIVSYWQLPEIFKSMDKPFEPKQDLSCEHEATLCKYAEEKFNSHFIYVNNYPVELRPAYTQPHSRKGYSRGFDLLFDGVEIVSGGQRVHDPVLLEKQFAAKGFNVKDFEFYFEGFRYGMPPHGGQAFGLERLTARLLKLNNVREATFFPRDRNRVTP
ncbi:MAG: aspartate--tRNA(Asn) ligase [Candidatus Micrarchaeota archaeon]